jgi:predicted Fe-Mo cluster-binding NifX family protein
MKLAIPVSSGRVSTAFDFARRLLLLEYEDGQEVNRAELLLEDEIPMSRARRLASLGVKALICGAISRSLAGRLVSSGIDVIPFVSGTVDEVLAAYHADELESAQFLLPGSTAEERKEWRTRREARAPAALAEGKDL